MSLRLEFPESTEAMNGKKRLKPCILDLGNLYAEITA